MVSALPSPPALESDRCIDIDLNEKKTPTQSPTSTLPLPQRFARIKHNLISGREALVIASWKRLLHQLAVEINSIAETGSGIIPSIQFGDIHCDTQAEDFLSRLKKHGVGVVREVVPRDVAEEWKEETDTYLAHNSIRPHTSDNQPQGIYWSPAQVKSRAHKRVLEAQKFVMSLWQPSDPNSLIAASHPISYADRIYFGTCESSDSSPRTSPRTRVQGGSVERWEPDGYGQGSTYQKIWDGDWEHYDPWDSSKRLKVTTDLYSGPESSSIFRVFQGWLPLSELRPEDAILSFCPMIQLSTAYFLLRPFFTPLKKLASDPSFLSPSNWVLESPMSPTIQGAVPSYAQELNTALHPHLQLDRSMVSVPHLEPGDYIVWHCDAVHAAESSPHHKQDAAIVNLPACPLTQTNALHIARQRKAFLLGHPSPDFDKGGGGRAGRGESRCMGRPGVQEVHEAGGEEGLRSMGLLAWDEDGAMSDTEADVLELANDVLFPDRHRFG
jgi:hypothetical protein